MNRLIPQRQSVINNAKENLFNQIVLNKFTKQKKDKMKKRDIIETGLNIVKETVNNFKSL